MSENKKGLSAFLNKNKKIKKTKASEADQADSQQVVKDVGANSTTEQASKNTPVANQDSSDEEVDELEIANKQLNYANIKETKDIASNKVGDDKKLGFGYEEEKKVTEDKPKEKQVRKFGDGQMTFSRPNKF